MQTPHLFLELYRKHSGRPILVNVANVDYLEPLDVNDYRQGTSLHLVGGGNVDVATPFNLIKATITAECQINTADPVPPEYVVQWDGTATQAIQIDQRVASMGGRTEAYIGAPQAAETKAELLIFLPPTDQGTVRPDVLILNPGHWLAIDGPRWAVALTMSEAIAKIV